MALITADKLQKSYDVIVVGSGAAGGQTAYTLTLDGARVLMLEAGRNYVPEVETPMFQKPEEGPLRGASTPDKPFGFYDATVDGGWEIAGEPYTVATGSSDGGEEVAGGNFKWWRARMLGGRTNHWGRISLRNGPYDFKPRSRDGLGFDWPLTYEEVAPYYDKVEMLIGVYGANDGLENTPNSSPGCLLPPPAPRVHDLMIAKAGRKLGIPMIAGHRAVLTRQLDWKNSPARLHPGNARAQKIVADAMRARAACFWATPCGRGCSTRANYQSTTVHLPPAMATGMLDVLPNAMAFEVTLGKNGRASGVKFIDKTARGGAGVERFARGRVVVLAASACDSVRILLNSRAAGGGALANSSGKLGKYLMDTVGSSLSGQIPVLENLPPHDDFGASGGHMYSPWWLYREQLAGKLGFARGYHIEFGGSRGMPSMGTFSGLEWLTGGSYGAKFREDARRYFGSFVGFAGRGEMIPNESSFCDLDPVVKDRWGIPVLRFHWKFSEHETRQAAHMQKTFAAIIDAMGGRTKAPAQLDGTKAIDAGGTIIHEVGGAIMGNDPKVSVTNRFGQTWDVPNLFITDGATFPSNADKNPTLTIMAMAWRNSDHILARMKRREL